MRSRAPRPTGGQQKHVDHRQNALPTHKNAARRGKVFFIFHKGKNEKTPELSPGVNSYPVQSANLIGVNGKKLKQESLKTSPNYRYCTPTVDDGQAPSK